MLSYTKIDTYTSTVYSGQKYTYIEVHLHGSTCHRMESTVGTVWLIVQDNMIVCYLTIYVWVMYFSVMYPNVNLEVQLG